MPQRLAATAAAEVVCNELLMNFCRGLIAPDPMRRFPSAEAADLVKEGAASFHRQLIKGDLASEYENEIRLWLEELECQCAEILLTHAPIAARNWRATSEYSTVLGRCVCRVVVRTSSSVSALSATVSMA